VRVIVRALLGLAAIVVAVALTAYGTLRASLPQLDGEQTVSGIGAPVTIERDALGVVTINAASRTDAAYALGYVHAQDRYFQMDLARRMSGGRLAELFGDIALDTDRRNRRHRFDDVADRVLESLPADQRAVLDGYAAGANAGLGSLRSRPFEYWLLRAKPHPWTTHDCLLVVFAMYLQLNDEDASLDRERGLISAALPRPMVEFLYSFAPESEAPIDGLVAAAAPPPAPPDYDLRERTAPVSRSARAHATFAPRGIGSNNWALAGSRTASGAAIVANDMHLGLGIPNSWYRVRMHFTTVARPDLAGVTLPGAPNLVVGSNGHIAWGFTNSYGDYSDLVLVETSPDGASYRSATGWRPLRHDAETLRSSSGRTETLDVVSTEWGPLLDQDFRGQRVALAWTAQRPEATNLRWLDLERTVSVQQALELAPTIGGPVQNFVVGDRAGHIGWTLLGRIPKRGAHYDAGVPADWTQPGAGWQGWLAPEDYPRVVDPPDGQLWSANNRVVGGSALALIGDGSPDRGARAQQIRDDLRALSQAHERDMLAIQLDDRAVYLAATQRRLLAMLDTDADEKHPARSEFRKLVADWDARADASSVGYRLVRTYNTNVERAVFEMLTVEVRNANPGADWQVPRQFSQPVSELLDLQPMHLLDARYASWRDFELQTVDETIAQLTRECPSGLASCRWGDYNVVTIRHPLSRAVPWLSHWLDMPRVPTNGDNDMPRVHGPGFGASERFAVSPGSESTGYFHMPGGQSGHPLSPYYRAGHDAWVRGEALPFLPGPEVTRVTLQPTQ